MPMQVAEWAVSVYERLGQLEGMAAASIMSDLKVGRLMAAAGARGALENVAINLEGISDVAFVGRMRERTAQIEARLSSSPVAANR